MDQKLKRERERRVKEVKNNNDFCFNSKFINNFLAKNKIVEIN